jgi:hypothetical protein
MYTTGDIVEIFAPGAGYRKYHLFIVRNEAQVSHFLYFNSGDGFENDFPVPPSEAECLPPSPTGVSVLSCTFMPRYTDRHLELYGAEKIGELGLASMKSLLDYIPQCRVLNGRERRAIIEALRSRLEL